MRVNSKPVILMFILAIELPDQVSNIIVSDINSMSVNITWCDKSKIKARNYIVDCFGCTQGIFPIPSKIESVFLEKLSPSTTYNISIAISNDITEITGVLNRNFIMFTTDPGGKKSFLESSWTGSFTAYHIRIVRIDFTLVLSSFF